MGKLKTLASDTVVYGASTILSRLIGWLMMPLYVRVVSQTVYGTFSYVYSWIAIFLVVVTLGFETGYFRFATDENRDRLLGTLSRTVFLFGLGLLLLTFFFPDPCCQLIDFDFGPQSGGYLSIMAAIVLLDSYNAIFFAELRYLRKSLLYALLRLGQVLVNVVLTVFFLFWLRHQGGFFGSVDDITYMMLANLAGSLFSTLYFIPRIAAVLTKSDGELLRKALLYSLPLVGMGFFGQANTLGNLVATGDTAKDVHKQTFDLGIAQQKMNGKLTCILWVQKAQTPLWNTLIHLHLFYKNAKMVKMLAKLTSF